MRVIICDESTANVELVYCENFFTGRRKLTYGGVELVRRSNKVFVLPATEERAKQIFSVAGNAFKGVSVSSALLPTAVMVRRKLTPLEYILAILPLIPSVFFGAVGGAVGGLFVAISLFLQVQIKSRVLKIIVGVELGAVGGLLAFLCAYGVALLIV